MPKTIAQMCEEADIPYGKHTPGVGLPVIHSFGRDGMCKITTHPGGCGHAIFSMFVYVTPLKQKEFGEILKVVFAQMRNSYGCVSCILGDSSSGQWETFLTDLGFEFVKYHNWAHGAHYHQRLMWKIL